MKKLTSLLVLSMFAYFAAIGQYRVEGKVSASDGSALPGARVQIEGKTMASGSDGGFVFENIQEGKHLLQVSFVGFEAFSKELEVQGNIKTEVFLTQTSIMTEEVTVAAVRARRNDPVAFSEVTRDEIEKNNFGQDIPSLLNHTPGLVISSDAGAGVGYTSMRLRGSDITRINITVDGIPLNDAESQVVYWVNMPDFASSISDVQVQRGVGTSTNGAASFGGSINMSTANRPGEKSVLLDNSFGSFNTQHNSVQVQTGLLKNNVAFDMRLSRIISDGFVDRGKSDLKSFYFSGGYFGDETTLKFVTFSGKEKTYQAWNGVPKARLENDYAAMDKLVMMDGWSDEEAENLYSSDSRTFNRYLYNNQTDNYEQNHYHIHLSQRFSSNFLMTGAVHYTHGKGYYESYKYNKKFSDYSFPYSEIVIDGETVKRTDLISQKWLDNDFYGVTASAVYKQGKSNIVIGGAWNRYDGDHYGDVIWTEYNIGLPNNHRWYFNEGTKTDFNYYAKANVEIIDNLSVYGDLQARHVSYKIIGVHDDGKDLSRSTGYDFFNPKAGLNYLINTGSRVYVSVAIANREPSRSDFRDADESNRVKAERLTDYEAGFDWNGKTWGVQINGFYMNYKDQMVNSGKINNVGSPILMNVANSYRFGVELSGQMQLNQRLIWSGNLVLSSNKIKDFTEFVDNWNWDEDDPDNVTNGPRQYAFNLGTTNIAFSPAITAASRFEAALFKGFSAILNTRYVDNQYIDNTSNSQQQIDSYLVNDLIFRYVLKAKNWPVIEFGTQINNLLNEQYASNGWVYSYVYDGERDLMDGYFPQAGRHFMAQVLVKF